MRPQAVKVIREGRDAGSLRRDVGGRGHWALLLAEHDFGGQSAVGIPLHAARRFGQSRGVSGISLAPDDLRQATGCPRRRWPSDRQGLADQGLRRGSERLAQSLHTAAVLAAPHPETPRTGEKLLSPVRVPLCLSMTKTL